MAVGAQARRYGVRIRKRESHTGMVKLSAEPSVGSMASLAGGRESRTHVTRIRGGLEVAGVTGIALRRQTLKLSRGRALVTGFAVDGGVRADQREAILMATH